MKDAELSITEILAILESSPDRFAVVARELGNQRFKWKPDKEAWSLNDNLAHIRACADVWGETIEQMLAREEPDLHHLHPREHMRQHNYHRLDYESSFSAFQKQRLALLARLRGLSPGEWERGAMIKTKDVNRHYTVFSQALRMALHEKNHWQQIQDLPGRLSND